MLRAEDAHLAALRAELTQLADAFNAKDIEERSMLLETHFVAKRLISALRMSQDPNWLEKVKRIESDLLPRFGHFRIDLDRHRLLLLH